MKCPPTSIALTPEMKPPRTKPSQIQLYPDATSENLTLGLLASGVLRHCHVIHDHRAPCGHD